MATERIEIIVSENGSRTVRRSIEGVGDSGRAAASGVDMLKKALLGLGVAGTLAYLKDQVDTYTNITNKLKLVTSSTENLKRVNDELFASAQRTRSSYEDTAGLYARLSAATQALGLSQKDMLSVTETVNKAMQVSGASAAEAQSAVTQFGQALAGGKLQAEEYNSIVDAAPRLVQALADSLANGDRGALRKMVNDQKVTAEMAIKAIQEQAPKLAEEFAKMEPTIASAFTVLSNSVLRSIGELDQATGASAAFARMLLAVAGNMDLLAGAATAVGIALVGAYGPSMVGMLASATRAAWGFTAALLANPFTAVAVGIALVVGGIIAFGDQVAVTSDGAVTLKDAFFATLSLVGDLFSTVASAAAIAWQATFGVIEELLGDWGVSWSDVLGFIGKVVRTYANLVVGFWKTAFDAIRLVWNNFPGYLDVLFTAAVNLGAAAAEKLLNAWQTPLRLIAGGLSLISDEAGAALSGFMDNFNISIPRAQASAAGAQFAKDFGETATANLSRDYMGELGSAIVARARKNAASAQGALDGAGTAKPKAVEDDDKKKKKGADKETRAEYLKRINEETDNSIKLAKAMNFEYAKVDEQIVGIGETLKKRGWAELTMGEESALRAKLKAMVDAEDMQRRMTGAYEEFAGPQRDYEKNQEAVNRVLAKFPQYGAEAQRALRGIREEFLRTKTDTASGLELGRSQFEGNLQDGDASRAAEAYKSLREQMTGETAFKEMGAAQAALNQLFAEGKISASQYGLELRQMSFEASALKVQIGDASAFDVLRGGLASFVSDFKGIVPGLSQAWGNFFTSFANNAASSIGRAIQYGEDLGGALKEVARSALAELIGALIKLGIQWVLTQVMGTTAMGAQTAASVAAAVTTAAAWAPAASMVSLASFGANAVPASAGIAATTALAKTLSVAGAFKDGGLITGPGGPRQDNHLAMVSSGEYVMNAKAVDRYGPLIEAMNSGRGLPAFADGGYVGGGSPASGFLTSTPTAAATAGASYGGDTFQLYIGDITSNDPEAVREQIEGALEEALPVFLDRARKQRGKDDRDNAGRQAIGGRKR